MSRRIRLLLLLTVVGVAGALLLTPAQAQFPPGGVGGRPGGGAIGGQPPAGFGGQPGNIGGGVGGQPPGNIGGIAGQPGNIGGINGQPGNIGGINGQPGNIGGINGQPGNIAGQPGFQGNNFAGGMGNPKIPPMPKMGPPEFEWVCSGCGAVVSTGPFKPTLASCPKCGVKFRNGFGGVDFNQGAAFNPPDPIGPPQNDFNNPPAAAWPPQNAPNNGNRAAFEAGRTMGRLMVVGLVGLGGLLVLIAVIVVVVILVSRSGSTASAPRQSRSRVFHDG